MLELYQYEGCPFCDRVRGALDDLGMDYVVRTVSRSQAKRERVIAISGQPQVPVLVDTDHDAVVTDSREILRYLQRTYGR